LSNKSKDNEEEDGESDSEESGKEILGMWVGADLGGFISFDSNGTGKIGYDETTATQFNWTYNKDREKYTLSIPSNEILTSTNDTLVINVVIQKIKSSSAMYIKLQGRYFFHRDGIGRDKMTFEIKTNSMSPVLREGNVIVSQLVPDASVLKVGDIITYWTVINGERVLNTHRIVEIYTADDALIFTTKGDNNSLVDALTVHEREIVGKYSYIIKK